MGREFYSSDSWLWSVNIPYFFCGGGGKREALHAPEDSSGREAWGGERTLQGALMGPVQDLRCYGPSSNPDMGAKYIAMSPFQRY